MSRIRAAALGAALILGISGIAGVAIARGQGGPGHGPGGYGMRHRGGFGGMLAKDLNLTDAQKAQVKTIHEKYKSQFESIRTQFKSQTDNARALRQKGDSAGARAVFQKTRVDIRQRILAVRQQEQAEIRNVLTTEQRAKFDAAQAQRKQLMEKRGEGRHGKQLQRGNPAPRS